MKSRLKRDYGCIMKNKESMFTVETTLMEAYDEGIRRFGDIDTVNLLLILKEQLIEMMKPRSHRVEDQTFAHQSKVCKFFIDHALNVWNIGGKVQEK